MIAGFIKDMSKIDLSDICSNWQWLIDNQQEVVLVSASGDMFLLGNDNSVYGLESLAAVAGWTVGKFPTCIKHCSLAEINISR